MQGAQEPAPEPTFAPGTTTSPTDLSSLATEDGVTEERNASITGPASGAEVTVTLLGSTDTAVVGDTVTFPVAATATADSTGAYEVRLTPSDDVLAEAASSDGWVNFQIAFHFGDEYKVRTLSRHWNGTSWDGGGWFTKQPSTVFNTVFLRDATGASLEARFAPDAAAAAGVVSCYWKLVDTFNRWTVVGELHNSNNINGNFRYGERADTDVSSGVKLYGKDWHLSGTTHESDHENQTIGLDRSGDFGRQLRSLFKYGIYVTVSTESHPAGYYCWGEHPRRVGDRLVKSLSWETGLDLGNDVSHWNCADFPDSHRVPYPAGGSYSKESSHAYWYYYAVETPVLTLGASSGFSRYVRLHWQFQSRGSLCGNNGTPSNASIIYTNR